MAKLDIQKEIFTKLKLSYENGLNLFDKIYSEQLIKIGKPSSQHQVLFSSISLNKKIKTILEIGTFDGNNIKFLSTLFPKASIVSVDLEDDNKLFTKSYGRDDQRKRASFIEYRNTVLNTCENVEFIKKNSIKYLFDNKKNFDLIWIDGAHGYPFVTIDITNCLKVLSSDGFLICDDIYKKIEKSDSFYRSEAAMQTLTSYLNAKVILEFNLIFKRLNDEEKFIAIVKGDDIIKEN